MRSEYHIFMRRKKRYPSLPWPIQVEDFFYHHRSTYSTMRPASDIIYSMSYKGKGKGKSSTSLSSQDTKGMKLKWRPAPRCKELCYNENTGTWDACPGLMRRADTSDWQTKFPLVMCTTKTCGWRKCDKYECDGLSLQQTTGH